MHGNGRKHGHGRKHGRMHLSSRQALQITTPNNYPHKPPQLVLLSLLLCTDPSTSLNSYPPKPPQLVLLSLLLSTLFSCF